MAKQTISMILRVVFIKICFRFTTHLTVEMGSHKVTTTISVLTAVLQVNPD